MHVYWICVHGPLGWPKVASPNGISIDSAVFAGLTSGVGRTRWRHIANTIERSMLGIDASCISTISNLCEYSRRQTREIFDIRYAHFYHAKLHPATIASGTFYLRFLINFLHMNDAQKWNKTSPKSTNVHLSCTLHRQ